MSPHWKFYQFTVPRLESNLSTLTLMIRPKVAVPQLFRLTIKPYECTSQRV
jgi:hypothetical protein